MRDSIRPRDSELSDETALAEKSLFEFSRQAWSVIRPGDPFVNGWCFGCICEHVQACYDGQIKKLGIAAPPRHGKSIPVCITAPGWEWARKPTTRFMFIHYQQRFANILSMACRNLIKSQWYQERWGHKFFFTEDTNRQDHFANDRGGFRLAAGIGGGVSTGEGGDIVTADDPLSVEDSFSAAAVEAVWRYWTQTMGLRFQNPELLRRIVCMQRLRKNDLLGRLMAESFGYEVLTLPFEGEPSRVYFLPTQKSELGLPPDPEGYQPPKHPIIPTSLQIKRPDLHDCRKDGEILWPERFGNPETVKDLKKSVAAGAAGQLQQRPEGDAGTIFKADRFKLCYPRMTEKGLAFLMGNGKLPRLVYAEECLWYQTVDTAMRAEQQNDRTAICTNAKTPYGELIVFDIQPLRLLVPEQWPAMKHFRHGRPQWDEASRSFIIPGKARPWPKQLSFQSVEDKNSGDVLIQVARAEHYPLRPLKADGNKVLRATTLATMYESGQVYHNAEMEYRHELEEELTSFPTAPHDDLVDAAAYAAILFVYDEIVSAFTGDIVYNERVHTELDVIAKLEGELRDKEAKGDGVFIPPALRPAAPSEPDDIDGILAALQGRPKPQPPALDDEGNMRAEFLRDED